jgi:WD40 repeat protein
MLIKKLTGHSNSVFSLISLNDETIASGSRGEIKIWSIKADTNIECIKTIKAHENENGNKNRNNFVFLQKFGNDFMVSKSKDEFIIWDVKNYNYLKTYKEDSFIQRLIVTGDNKIITATKENFVNVWHI